MIHRSRLAVRRAMLFALLVCAIFAIFIIANRADRQSNSAPALQVPTIRNSLTGTWKGEDNYIMNLRADGTGRSRYTTNTKNRIGYFEWDADQSTFTVTMVSRNKAIRILNTLVNSKAATDHYSISNVSPEGFELVEETSGKRLKFVRTQDSTLESAW